MRLSEVSIVENCCKKFFQAKSSVSICLCNTKVNFTPLLLCDVSLNLIIDIWASITHSVGTFERNLGTEKSSDDDHTTDNKDNIDVSVGTYNQCKNMNTLSTVITA